MTQKSWVWGGTVIGDASYAAFSSDEWTDIWSKLLSADITLEGVIGGYGDELRVDKIDNSTVRVYTGAAIVDGTFYETDATVDLSIVSDGTYRIVLQKGWTAQTVRAVAVSGATVTQTDGVTWEIKLAEVVKSGGVIAAPTDVRVYIHFATAVNTQMMENNIFPFSSMSDGVPVLPKRYGGSATDWNSPGSTGYTVDDTAVIRVGTYQNVLPTGATTGAFIVLFRAFEYLPLFFVSHLDEGVLGYDVRFVIDSINSTYCIVRCYRDVADSGNTDVINFMWMAVGQEAL